MKRKICKYPGCQKDITETGNRTYLCIEHQELKNKENKLRWVKKNRIETQEPESARSNKVTWSLWNAFNDLMPQELSVLIEKRKHEFKFEKDGD